MKMASNSTISPFKSDVAFASDVILTVLSSLLFFLACLVLFVYFQKRIGRSLLETRLGIVLFFLGALLTTISTLGCYKNTEIYGIYRLFVEVFIGIVSMLCGSAVLFEAPNADREMDDYGRALIPIGHSHSSMGIVIWTITLPLSTLEMFFAIGAATKSPAPVYATVEFVSFIQKIVQASVYHFSLRHKVPKPLMRMGCSWFFKIISLFNFAFWVDSVITNQTDNKFVMELFGNGFSIVKVAYNALLIDYRLLCCLVFLEHALELDDIRDSRIEVPYDPFDEPVIDSLQSSTSVNVQVAQYSGYGYVIGLACLGLQLVNGLQYLHFVGVWTNIFSVLADLLTIIFGLIMVNVNSSPALNTKWRDTESKAIDVMVGFMGAIGFVFWIMKTSFCFLWSLKTKPVAELTHSYLIWTAVKNVLRAVGMVFQMHFFVKMGPNFCSQPRNIRRKIYHFLVPAIMLSLLSIFVNCVIDQYNGRVEQLIRQSNIEPAVLAFFGAAAPIHLGFSLHMFLHFFIMKRKMSLDSNQQPLSVHATPIVEQNSVDEQEPLIPQPEAGQAA